MFIFFVFSLVLRLRLWFSQARVCGFACLVVVMAAGLSACVTTPEKPLVYASPVSTPSPVGRPKTLSVTDKLLLQAEKRFKQGKLLTPEEDNAFIRYRAILLMEPDNRAAQAGLDAILLDGVTRARDALASSRLRSAQSQHDDLLALFGSHSLLSALSADIHKARQVKPKLAAVKPKKVTLPDNREFLDKDALSKRSTSIRSELRAFALALSQTNESVLIYARSDAEGRWIYQQMREAVPDYRIRGDIRIGKPALRKLPPLD